MQFCMNERTECDGCLKGGKSIALEQSQLVSWCFESSQPQRIISEPKETFIKRLS